MEQITFSMATERPDTTIYAMVFYEGSSVSSYHNVCSCARVKIAVFRSGLLARSKLIFRVALGEEGDGASDENYSYFPGRNFDPICDLSILLNAHFDTLKPT